METSNKLNAELNQYRIDNEQYHREKDKLEKETHCCICKEDFKEILVKIKAKYKDKQRRKKWSSKYNYNPPTKKMLHHDHCFQEIIL